MLDAFGSVDNLSIIRRTGYRCQQDFGYSSENIIKVQKSLSDLFDLSS